jgi:hypothetical protein
MTKTLHSPNGIAVRIEEIQLKKLNAAGIDIGALADEAHAEMKKSREISVQADYGGSVVPFRLKTEGGQEYLECDGPLVSHSIAKP